jgi:hypothetical protein
MSGHFEMDPECNIIGELYEDVFAAAGDTLDLFSLQNPVETLTIKRIAYGDGFRRSGYMNTMNRFTDDSFAQSADDCFNFGEFGHGS